MSATGEVGRSGAGRALLHILRERRGVGIEGHDYRALIIEERRRLLALLEGLDESKWDHETLCEGWRVREVVAHLISGGTRVPFSEMVPLMVRHRGDVDAFFAADAQRRAAAEPQVLLEGFRTMVESRVKPPVVPAALMWCDNVIHGLDIRWPLARPDPGPAERLTETATCLSAMTWPSRIGCRADGLRFAADDAAWSMGDGAEVSGPIDAIVLGIAGRGAAFERLRGPGVALLAARP